VDHLRVFAVAGSDATSAPRASVYACRHCREAVKVTAVRYLPEACPSCEVATWDEAGRCGNWEACEAVRRPGIRGRSHCPSCGHSIWILVGVAQSAAIG
jgi:hypothetical protein